MEYSEKVKQYARAVHRLTCQRNHTDDCGWFCGEEARLYDYERTRNLLRDLERIVSVEQLDALADILRPHTKRWDEGVI